MKALWLPFPFPQLGRLPLCAQQARQPYLLGLLAFFLFCSCPCLALAVPGGDLAPRNAPDGQLNVGDLVVLERFVFGILTPTADEFKIGDVAPLGAPDNQLNGADVVLLQRAIFGLVTLPEVQLGPPTLSGNLNTSTPLAAATYLVTGNITVLAGQTLTIQPGAILKFEGNYTFTVNGALVAGNTTGSPVTFTSSKAIPASGDWAGIVLKGAGSVISNAVIEYASNGITVDGVSGALSNTVLRNCYCGIMMQNNASGTVSGNKIFGNSYGIWLQGSGASGQNPLPVVNNNDIYDNTVYNLYTYNFYDAGHVTVNATNNWWGSTNATTISAKIYDHLDNSTAPMVSFMPFLGSAGGGPLATPTLPEDLDFGPTTGMQASVNITNGLLVQARNDFAFATPNGLGLGLSAVYNSRLARLGAMGYGWTHSWEASLQPAVVVNGQSYLKITDSGGQGHYFQDAGGGTYQGAFCEPTSVRITAGVYAWTLLNGTTMKFNSSGKLTGTSDAVGNTLTLGYDGSSRLSTVTDSASGRSFTLNYNPANLVQSVTGPVTTAVSSGIWVSYGYDSNNNLTSVTYADGSGFTYEYTDASGDIHNLTAQKNKMGHTQQTWTYDSQDRVTQAWNVSNGGISQVTYTSATSVTVTDAYSVARTYSITNLLGHNRLTAMSGPVPAPYDPNPIIRWEYDTNLNLYETEDGAGAVHRYENFDSRGNPGLERLAAGTPQERAITYTWHPWINTPLTRSEASVLSPTGSKVTIFDYDSDGNTTANQNPGTLVSRMLEQGYTRNASAATVAYDYITSYTYNAKGQITNVDGPLAGTADSTSYAYDAATANLLAVTRPLVGATTLSNYDAAGQVGTVTDINNLPTTYTYDGHGRVTQVRHPDNSTSTTLYNLAGLPATVTDEDGVTTTYTYQATTGRRERVTDAAGNYILYTYNEPNDRPTKAEKFDAANVRRGVDEWSYLYPANPGRLWKEIQANGTFTEYGYDAAGNIASIKDPEGYTTSYGNDLFGRRTTSTQPGTVITGQGYDRQGNVISVTDPEGHATTSIYDDMGRLLQNTSPDSDITKYFYDLANSTVVKTDARGIATTTTYDLLNRPVSITYPDTTENVAFTYDQGEYGKGQRSGFTDPSGATSFGYDTRGRLTSQTSTINGVAFDTSRVFSHGGRLTWSFAPSGRFSGNTLDPVTKKTTKVKLWTNTAWKTLADNITYRPFGGTSGFSFGSGAAVTNDFNECGCGVHTTNAGRPNEIVYTYDNNKNLTSVAWTNKPDKNQTFGYDALQRLESATGLFGTTGFTYDKVSNRRTKTENNVVDTYTYPTGNNRLSGIIGGKTVSFTYDQAGNIKGYNNKTLTYNDAGRLEQVTSDGVLKGRYTYNALGLRVKKEGYGSVVTYYLYDFDGHLQAEVDSTGAIQKEYIYRGSSLLAMADASGNIFYYGSDHLGTPQVLINDANQAVWEAVYYKPFGEAHVNKNSTVVNNIRFPGQYYDEETGLHYNWNRYYDPGTGRYLTPDPIGLAGGINLFGYVAGNPVNYTDPKGLQKIYGNWCGPDWTGGYKKSWDQLTKQERQNALPPTDDLDECCQSHDKCYSRCRENFPCLKDDRQLCFQECDRGLNMCPGTKNVSGPRSFAIRNYMHNNGPGAGDNNSMCCGK